MAKDQKMKLIEKGLKKLNIQVEKDKCGNEVNTNRILIEPFFQILGYKVLNDVDGSLQPEVDAFFSKKGEKVDYAIKIKGKFQILIESKKAKTKLDKHLLQLKNYFNNIQEAKLGILTNGTRFEFYTRDGNNLNVKPFFVFDWEDYNSSDIETLSMFYYPLEISKIIDYAKDIYFLEGFDQALFEELADPSDGFLKSILNKMGEGGLTKKRKERLYPLVNSISIKGALEELLIKEANESNTGVITTQEELKIYHSIKTILATDKNIESDRIGYIDKAKQFSVVVDGKRRNHTICDITINSKGQFIEIDKDKYQITGIQSIVDLKSKLVSKAKSILPG